MVGSINHTLVGVGVGLAISSFLFIPWVNPAINRYYQWAKDKLKR